MNSEFQHDETAKGARDRIPRERVRVSSREYTLTAVFLHSDHGQWSQRAARLRFDDRTALQFGHQPLRRRVNGYQKVSRSSKVLRISSESKSHK